MSPPLPDRYLQNLAPGGLAEQLQDHVLEAAVDESIHLEAGPPPLATCWAANKVCSGPLVRRSSQLKCLPRTKLPLRPIWRLFCICFCSSSPSSFFFLLLFFFLFFVVLVAAVREGCRQSCRVAATSSVRPLARAINRIKTTVVENTQPTREDAAQLFPRPSWPRRRLPPPPTPPFSSGSNSLTRKTRFPISPPPLSLRPAAH